jgi:hypothetical protein
MPENTNEKKTSLGRPIYMIEELCFLSPVASVNKPHTVKDAHDDNSLEINVIICCLFADYL